MCDLWASFYSIGLISENYLIHLFMQSQKAISA